MVWERNTHTHAYERQGRNACEEQARTLTHLVHLVVGWVVLLRVLEHDLHVLVKIVDAAVLEQLRLNGAQVHGVRDHLEVIGSDLFGHLRQKPKRKC